MRRSDRGMRLVVALVVLGLVTSCVKANDPSVKISAAQADLVFGAPKPAAGPPNQAPTLDASVQTVQGGVSLTSLGVQDAAPPIFDPFYNPAADGLPPLPTYKDPNAGPCPAAPPTAVAERPTETVITYKPATGLYRWKRHGTLKPAGAPQGIPVTGFEQRLVQNVREVDERTYTFEVVQPRIEDPKTFAVNTFRVEDPPDVQANPGGGIPVQPPRADEPEGGIALVKTEIYNENSSTPSDTWEPTTGVLLLPLPVISGEEYKSVANDPKGLTIVHEARVMGRQRIDACGEVLDGWRVEATETRSDSDVAMTYTYVIATQYGGIIIFEDVNWPRSNGSSYHVDFNIGQVNPSPTGGGSASTGGSVSTDEGGSGDT